MKNRRENDRINSRLEVLFADFSSFYRAYTKDISHGGLFFVSNTHFDTDQKIMVTLILENKSIRQITLEGKVVHLREEPPGSSYRYGIGLEFSKINENIKADITNLIEELKADKRNVTNNDQGGSIPVATLVESMPLQDEPKANSLPAKIEKQLVEIKKRLRSDDYYKWLEIKKTADIKEIKKVYDTFCLLFHPDLHRDNLDHGSLWELEEVFSKITTAYKTLKIPSKKREYDNQLTVKRSTILQKQQSKQKEFEKKFPDQAKKAHRIYEQAMSAAAENEIKAALNSLRIAVTLNPFNPAYKKKLKELESMLES